MSSAAPDVAGAAHSGWSTEAIAGKSSWRRRRRTFRRFWAVTGSNRRPPAC